MAVLPTPGSPISTGLFLVRRASTCMVRRISSSRPITGSSLPSRASWVISRAYFFSASKLASALGESTLRPLRMSATAFSSPCGCGAGGLQRPRGRGVGGGERHQQPVLRDVLVAGLRRRLLRGVQYAHQFGGDLRLAGAGTLHLRLPGECGLHLVRGGFRVAARGADQAGGGAFLVIEQGLEEVFGGDPLVEVADGNCRRGL